MRTRHASILAGAVVGLFVGLAAVAPAAAGVLVGIGLVALPAWFPARVSRAVGAILLAAVAFVVLRHPLGTGGGAAFSLLLGSLATWKVPLRLLRRVCFLVPSLLLLVYVTTLLMYEAPGSPFAEERAVSPEILAAKRAVWGVPESPLAFFGVYVKRLVVDFDLGPSLSVQGRSVSDLLGRAFPVSMSLGLIALILACVLGLALGIRAGLKPNSLADHTSMALAVAGISLPNFVVGAFLLLLFALGLRWLPVGGWGRIDQIVLPAVTLALPFCAYIARLARGGTIQVMQEDFIRTARAKGLSETTVILRHGLRGAILPVVSYLGPAAAGILTGSFVVERLFHIPGMGQWFVQSAINRDYSVVLGTAILYFAVVFTFNLFVDFVLAWLDPRVREAS
ncbi:MAG: ABC transporter permease [Planctomycetota bacterium]